jgi:hypothetical protein
VRADVAIPVSLISEESGAERMMQVSLLVGFFWRGRLANLYNDDHDLGVFAKHKGTIVTSFTE